MIRLPRRLALWGGAAAVAAGGFAFMASNTVLASSAGEGAGPVSGYIVSHQSYSFVNNTTGKATLAAVKFLLTSASSTSNAAVQPANVQAYPQAPGTARPWGKSLDCTLTGTWTMNTTGQGQGTYSCTFAPVVYPVATLVSLDVEANQ